MPGNNRDLLINMQLKLDAARAQVRQFNQDVQQAFKQSGSGTNIYKTLSKDLAEARLNLEGLVKEQKELNLAIAQEATERKKANQAIGQAGANIANSLPGGNILTAGFGAGAGLTGGLILGGAAAVTGALTLLAAKANEAGEGAEAITKYTSDTGGAFDQLRASALRLKESQDALSASPAAARFQTFKNDAGTWMNDLFGRVLQGIDDSGEKLFSGKKAEQVDRERWESEQQAKTPLSLTGDAKLQLDEINHSEEVANKQLGMQKMQIEHDIASQRMQLALDVQQSEMEAARKKYEIEKDASRELTDYRYNRAKTLDDFEGKQSQARFQLERQNAQANYDLKQRYDATNFANTLGDKSQDYNIQRGRDLRSFRDNIQDLALSGAGGLDYLKASRSNREKLEDAAVDYQKERARSIRDFGLGKQQEGEQFALSNQQANASNALDIQARQYQIAQQLYTLDRDHARALEDSTEKLKEWSQDLDMSRSRLNLRASDQQFQAQQQVDSFNLQAQEQARSFSMAKGQFAASIWDQNKDIFNRLALSNPDMELWLNQQLGRRGEPGYINPLRLPEDTTPQTQILPSEQPGSDHYGYGYEGYSNMAAAKASSNPYAYGTFQYSQQQQPIQINFNPQINPSFPTVGGVNQQQYQQQYQDVLKVLDKYQQAISALNSETANAINGLGGGSLGINNMINFY